MHEKYSPEIIINAGSAGGLKEKHSVGDIIISSEVIHHDVDATVFDYELGQVPQMPERFSADKTLIELVKYSSKNFDFSFYTGYTGTGESLISKYAEVILTSIFVPEILDVDIVVDSSVEMWYSLLQLFVVIRSL